MKRRAYERAIAEVRSAPTHYAWARALRARREYVEAISGADAPGAGPGSPSPFAVT